MRHQSGEGGYDGYWCGYRYAAMMSSYTRTVSTCEQSVRSVLAGAKGTTQRDPFSPMCPWPPAMDLNRIARSKGQPVSTWWLCWSIRRSGWRSVGWHLTRPDTAVASAAPAPMTDWRLEWGEDDEEEVHSRATGGYHDSLYSSVLDDWLDGGVGGVGDDGEHGQEERREDSDGRLAHSQRWDRQSLRSQTSRCSHDSGDDVAACSLSRSCGSVGSVAASSAMVVAAPRSETPAPQNAALGADQETPVPARVQSHRTVERDQRFLLLLAQMVANASVQVVTGSRSVENFRMRTAEVICDLVSRGEPQSCGFTKARNDPCW